LIWFGLLLGILSSLYIVFKPAQITLPFPSINYQMPLHPTFSRISQFISGRLIGNIILMIIFTWIGQYLKEPGIVRFILGISIVLSIFMLQFYLIQDSPDMGFANLATSKQISLVFLNALNSSIYLHAPNLIYMLAILSESNFKENMNLALFFSIGQFLVVLPLILNLSWVRTAYFQQFSRLCLLIGAIASMIFFAVKFIVYFRII
jgi:hypothetical protein